MAKVVASLVGVLWVIGVAGRAHAGPAPSQGIRRIEIHYSRSSFRPERRHYVITQKAGTFEVGGKPVDRRAIDALEAALVDLRSVEAQQTCISHTDDYPVFVVTIEGSREVVLRSDSNCADHVPWNVLEDGRTYVQYTGAIGRALQGLLADIDGAHWPRTTYSLPGGELVELGHYKRGEPSARAAARCAKSLEASRRARALIGPFQVSWLQLRCPLEHGACDRVIATVHLALAAVDAELELPCVAGAIRIDPRALGVMRDFLRSRPARTIIQLSDARPRLRPGRPGPVLTSPHPLPRLTLDPRRHVIEVRSLGHGPSGVAFWRALGIDPSKLTSPSPPGGVDETVGELDFAGKLVP